MTSEVHAGSDIQRGCFSSLKLPGFSNVLWIKGDLEAVKRVSSPNQQHTQVQPKPGALPSFLGSLPLPAPMAPCSGPGSRSPVSNPTVPAAQPRPIPQL